VFRPMDVFRRETLNARSLLSLKCGGRRGYRREKRGHHEFRTGRGIGRNLHVPFGGLRKRQADHHNGGYQSA
jgi:hypothetical protein